MCAHAHTQLTQTRTRRNSYINKNTKYYRACSPMYNDIKYRCQQFAGWQICNLLASSHMEMCVRVLTGVRVCICSALKSSCSVSHDRPSVCRCSRSGGVPGEVSKSSQGSGGGEPRLSESFSMFIHPVLLLLLWKP